jgi:DNA-binding response OmpR family regulator
VTATDGNHGLDHFCEHHPYLVILELTLRGRNGYEVLQEIRRVSEVPVLMISARDSVSEQVRRVKLGADCYLTKPFYPVVILEGVRNLRRAADDGACDKRRR